ncbi:hypothetical protein F4677DRAFT_397513 [Hypoxylon crocopeplum]|nr:hypothetical protein F4677DRAFT_397513 [Hypoxylon crocopeplum]
MRMCSSCPYFICIQPARFPNTRKGTPVRGTISRKHLQNNQPSPKPNAALLSLPSDSTYRIPPTSNFCPLSARGKNSINTSAPSTVERSGVTSKGNRQESEKKGKNCFFPVKSLFVSTCPPLEGGDCIRVSSCRKFLTKSREAKAKGQDPSIRSHRRSEGLESRRFVLSQKNGWVKRCSAASFKSEAVYYRNSRYIEDRHRNMVLWRYRRADKARNYTFLWLLGRRWQTVGGWELSIT